MTAATKPRCRQYVTCKRCRKPNQRHEGHGLCRGCHVRWDNAGRPASGPPPAIPPQVSGMRGALHLIEKKTRRLEDFADLDAWGAGYREAAERLEVSASTVFRYRAALREGPVQLRFPVDYEQREAADG